jgi:hypothetical protein
MKEVTVTYNLGRITLFFVGQDGNISYDVAN